MWSNFGTNRIAQIAKARNKQLMDTQTRTERGPQLLLLRREPEASACSISRSTSRAKSYETESERAGSRACTSATCDSASSAADSATVVSADRACVGDKISARDSSPLPAAGAGAAAAKIDHERCHEHQDTMMKAYQGAAWCAGSQQCRDLPAPPAQLRRSRGNRRRLERTPHRVTRKPKQTCSLPSAVNEPPRAECKSTSSFMFLHACTQAQIANRLSDRHPTQSRASRSHLNGGGVRGHGLGVLALAHQRASLLHQL